MPNSDDPATFLSLGIKSFTDAGIQKMIDKLAFTKKQSAHFANCVTRLYPYFNDVSDEEINLHGNRCKAALVCWGAKAEKLAKLGGEALAQVLSACNALLK